MSRIPCYKAHKYARRIAARLKESARTSHLRPDDTAKPATRRAKRSAGVAGVILAIAMSHVTPACAWAHSATTTRVHVHAYHAGQTGKVGNGSSAIAAFRVRYGAN